MNTIELMLDANKAALFMVEYWSQGRADKNEVAKIKAAIAAGEAELKREPDGWKNRFDDCFTSPRYKRQFPKVIAEQYSVPLYTREEIK